MRTTATLIGLLVLGSLVACSDASDDTAATDAPTTETEAPATDAPAETDPPVETEAPAAGADWSATCGEYQAEDPADTAQVEDMCAAVQAFTDAINTYDTDALLAATTEDFMWTSTGDPMTRDEYVAHFEANYERGNFVITHAEPVTFIVAGFTTYEGVQAGEVTSQDYNATGTSTYIVTGVDVDGGLQWLVSEFIWTEDAS